MLPRAEDVIDVDERAATARLKDAVTLAGLDLYGDRSDPLRTLQSAAL